MRYALTVVIMLLILNAVLMTVVMTRVNEYKDSIDKIVLKSQSEERASKTETQTKKEDIWTVEPQKDESIFSDLSKKKTKTKTGSISETEHVDVLAKPEALEIKKEIPSTLSEKAKSLLQEAEGFNDFWSNMGTLNMLKPIMNEDEFYTLLVNEVANFLQLTPEQKQYFLSQAQTILFQVKLYEQESKELADMYKKGREKYENDYDTFYSSAEWKEYQNKQRELLKKMNKFTKEAADLIRNVIPKDTIRQKLFSNQVDRIIRDGVMGGSYYPQYYYDDYYEYWGE